MALDMLFAPEAAMIRPPAALWLEIQSNASRLVTRRASVFLRYCRQQSNKYGIKGSRVAAAREALALLVDAEAKYGTAAKLIVAETELAVAASMSEHMILIDLPTPAKKLVRMQCGLAVRRWNCFKPEGSPSHCPMQPKF
jgi:hypothetical protein